MKAIDPSEGWVNEEGRMRGGAGSVPLGPVLAIIVRNNQFLDNQK